jgi:ubiquinone/menaquinone biosynthesis C-methylase UbiE
MNADRATDPQQYDSPEMNWQILGAEEARKYFRDALDAFVEPGTLEGKRVVDIGSGTGHLFNWLKDKGALSVTGIDPATKNIAISQEKYPWATSIVSTLEDFALDDNQKGFDVAFCILAFEHIQNLDTAFSQVNSLLSPQGKFYLVITDKDYHLSSDKELRSSGFVSVEILNDFGDGTVETRTVRDLGEGKRSEMFDILRPLAQVKAAAEKNSFALFAEKPLMSSVRASFPVVHVLGFEKK